MCAIGDYNKNLLHISVYFYILKKCYYIHVM
ncbi:hypothetical protein SAMN05444673_3881 [Bacillus sp. OV166]|nr:hypothetical protein SAMN05444673_3881 [Bacillus sp. OV166]